MFLVKKSYLPKKLIPKIAVIYILFRLTYKQLTNDIAKYLCPLRRITFDGFVSIEGRRFGVPYWYTKKDCRVRRDKDTIYIYDEELSRVLTSHPVTWSKKDSFCRDQYVMAQPEELPTASIKTIITQKERPKLNPGFEKFNFDKED